MNDNRRDAIADAAIEIIATQGLRALTHRAIDSKLDYPTGSTSYYLRTRQALIEAVVNRLSMRTISDVFGDQTATNAMTAEEVAKLVGGLIAGMAKHRPLDHMARFALRIDLVNEPELHSLISDASPIRASLLAASEVVLLGMGVQDAQTNAADLVALVDSLLFDQLTNTRAAANPTRLILAYLKGLQLEAKFT